MRRSRWLCLWDALDAANKGGASLQEDRQLEGGPVCSSGTQSWKAPFATSASKSTMRSASRNKSSSDLSTSAALSLAGPLSVHFSKTFVGAHGNGQRAESGRLNYRDRTT